MSNPSPQYFTYDAERSVLVPRRKALADREYTDGEMYRVGVIEERSTNSHNHYFAALHEAWLNLSEEATEQFLNEEHMRKYALIKCGYYNERQFVCSSKAEAQRFVAFLRPIDPYAVIVASDATVRELTAKSQSQRAMGAKDFQASKEAVLELVSTWIGIVPKTLSANAGRAA